MTPPARRLSPLENLFALRRDPFGLFAGLVEEHGRERALIRFDTGGPQPLYLVNDPETVREVLVSREHQFRKWFHNALTSEILSGGLVVSGGETHRQMRRLVQPAFHGRCLPHYAAQTVAVGGAERDRWPEDAVFDLEPALLRLTTRVTGRLLFGVDLAGTDATDLLCAATQTILSLFGAHAMPAAERSNYEAARANFQAVLADLAARRQASGVSPAAHPDLLDLLLAARWEDGNPLSPAELDDQMRTILLAGQNTTAEALLWTFYLLATHPAAEAKILAEIDGLPGPATFEDFGRLTYTRQVWQESLRLYPPIYLVAREARTDLSLRGEDIPAGAVILLLPYLLQRDLRFWPEPDRFRPERWAPEASPSTGPSRPRFCYFPFGAGSRRCIGEAVADMEGVLLLTTILQRRRLRLAAQPPIKPRAVGFLLRSERGLLVTAGRR